MTFNKRLLPMFLNTKNAQDPYQDFQVFFMKTDEKIRKKNICF